MRQQLSPPKSAATLLLGPFILCVSVAPCRAVEPLAENDAYRIELAASRDVTYTGVKGTTVQEHALQVTDKASGKSQTIVFGGSDKPVVGDLESVRIRGDRLVATTGTALGVFDLRAGREQHLTRCLDPEISTSGRWGAYKAFQPRFLPAEATSHVVLVFDVDTLADAVVFPESEKVSAGTRGELLAWEDDPKRRLRVGKLFWGPREETLLFFGKRWPIREPQRAHASGSLTSTRSWPTSSPRRR